MLSLEILEGIWLIGWVACLVRHSGLGALEK